jgi:hypothetical protein
MNDDTLLSRLAPVTDEQAAAMVSRHAVGELAEDIVRTPTRQPPAARHQARPVSRTRRRLAWAAGSALVAGAAAAVAVTALGGQPAPAGNIAQNATSGSSPRPTPTASTTLTAWTVTENPDGTLKVTIREMEDPSGLQATLRADGARVVVTASLAWPTACREWQGGNYQLGDQVVQTENRTGLPSADGTEFLIRPSAIPAGRCSGSASARPASPTASTAPLGP